jgi:hypothetical protein
MSQKRPLTSRNAVIGIGYGGELGRSRQLSFIVATSSPKLAPAASASWGLFLFGRSSLRSELGQTNKAFADVLSSCATALAVIAVLGAPFIAAVDECDSDKAKADILSHVRFQGQSRHRLGSAKMSLRRPPF